MTEEIFVVAYEGDDDSTKVLDYAMARARLEGAALHVVHVLEWSPYSFLTKEEVEERHARRKEEVARARAAIIDPAVERVQAAGIPVTGELRYGQVVELITEIAVAKGAAMIFVGRSGANSMAARVFGSVPLGLAQVAPVPTVIVP